MIIKIVAFFLVFMMVLGMLGKLRLPHRRSGGQGRLSKPHKCRRCGRFVIGSGPCSCERKR